MDRRCCVPNCGKTRIDDYAVLHSFPNPEKYLDLFIQWTREVGLDTSLDPIYVYKNLKVCHDHFDLKFLTWTSRLIPGAVPTLLLPGSNMAKVPLLDITSPIESVSFDAASPSTSTTADEFSVQEVDHLSDEETCETIKSRTVIKKVTLEKDSYATKLKKALKLPENKIFPTLAALFTVMKFRKISKNNDKMRRRFTKSEIVMALSLYKQSPKAYRWLQKVFVLPSSMTLSRLIARSNLRSGVNKNLFQQLKKRVDKMNPEDKLSLLLFLV